MKKVRSDFAWCYFEDAAHLIKETLAVHPKVEIKGTWGPWGSWRFSQQDDGLYTFWCQDCGAAGGYWEGRANKSHFLRFSEFDKRICEAIRELTEYDMWHHYIGAEKHGWSLRWYEAIQNACKKVNNI